MDGVGEWVARIIFSFSFSEVVILSRSAISLARLPVFSPRARGEMERFWSHSECLGKNRPHE